MTSDFQGNARSLIDNDLQTGQVASLREDVRMETKAASMHLINRQRAQHFLAPIMTDSAMDVMLSLFVGELQHRKLGGVALATANMLNSGETERLTDRLVQAGLAVVTGLDPEERAVGLTPLGSARMRSFVNDYPDV